MKFKTFLLEQKEAENMHTNIHQLATQGGEGTAETPEEFAKLAGQGYTLISYKKKNYTKVGLVHPLASKNQKGFVLKYFVVDQHGGMPYGTAPVLITYLYNEAAHKMEPAKIEINREVHLLGAEDKNNVLIKLFGTSDEKSIIKKLTSKFYGVGRTYSGYGTKINNLKKIKNEIEKAEMHGIKLDNLKNKLDQSMKNFILKTVTEAVHDQFNMMYIIGNYRKEGYDYPEFLKFEKEYFGNE